MLGVCMKPVILVVDDNEKLSNMLKDVLKAGANPVLSGYDRQSQVP